MTNAIRETLRRAPTPALRLLLTWPEDRFLAGDYVDEEGRRCLLGVLEGWGTANGERFRQRDLGYTAATAHWDLDFAADPALAVTELRAEVRSILEGRTNA
jgi:hypothetical protein